ncbi:Cadherin-89D, partial [Fragariocoptes setiger]
PSLSSSAKLWITVADMNDAVPNFAKAVYTLEVAENAKLGDTVFVMNAGKGAFKYSWHANDSGATDTFTLDATSGAIKLAALLDSVQRNHYRLTVRAQDESDPPKFDTAELNILVGTGQGVRLFAKRVYEVSVLENQLAPLMLIDLNATDEIIHQPVHYSIVGSDYRGLFRIDSDSGRLSVVRSLDRERRDTYTLKIKAENQASLSARQKRDTLNERWSSASASAQTGAGGAHEHQHQQVLSTNRTHNTERLLSSYHLAYDETFVSITVDDENDNVPVFVNKNKPIVTAVPLEATFGYECARVEARDADLGLNAAIKYEIVARGDDASSKFYCDPTTGVIRSMVNFALDSGRVYHFDVRATDREGGTSTSSGNNSPGSPTTSSGGATPTIDANSATTSVFVHVLAETKMVLMVTDTEPIVMEKRSSEVINYLSNVTGFDVKLAKLEPHIEGESPEPFSTDMFLYGVNPSLNSIVDTETLLNVFRQSSQTILSQLHHFKIRRIQGVMVQEKISQMGATEIAIIALSSIIFIGSILAIAMLCSSCKQKRKLEHLTAGSSLDGSPSQQSLWDNHHQQQQHHHRAAALYNHALSKQLVSTQQHMSLANSVAHQLAAGQTSANSTTYSTTGDAGANSSEYVDSLISSYKHRASLAHAHLSPGAIEHASLQRAHNNHNNNHHLHHHQQQQQQQQVLYATAGRPLAALPACLPPKAPVSQTHTSGNSDTTALAHTGSSSGRSSAADIGHAHHKSSTLSSTNKRLGRRSSANNTMAKGDTKGGQESLIHDEHLAPLDMANLNEAFKMQKAHLRNAPQLPAHQQHLNPHRTSELRDVSMDDVDDIHDDDDDDDAQSLYSGTSWSSDDRHGPQRRIVGS